MNRVHVLSKPIKIADLKFDDFFDEISHDWQHKAKQLQARRWRQLKRQVKTGNYH